MMKRKVRIALALAALLLLSCMTACAEEKPASEASETAAKAGNTWIMVNAACTIEMNGKSGQIDGVTATGNLPIAKLTMGAPDDTNADSHMEIEGEGPIAVHIDEAREFSILIGNSQYCVSAEADQSALIEASAAGASLKPTEATQLQSFVFYLEDTVTLTVSGRVEELLRITREREGVYLVEGLSGSGTLRCESTDTYELLAEQNYEAGENRSFRVSWDGKTATITEADS